MDPLDLIARVAAKARQEPAPAIHLDCARVLREGRRYRTPSYALAWPAAGSALAAALILSFCLWWSSQAASASTSDPVAQLFNPVQVELP